MSKRGRQNKSKKLKRQRKFIAPTQQSRRIHVTAKESPYKFAALLGIVASVVTILGFVAYLYIEIPTPHIVFLDVKQVSDNPLNHQFTLSNTGNGNADNLHVVVKMDMKDTSGRFQAENVTFYAMSLIEDISVPRNQNVSFDLNRAVPLNHGLFKFAELDEIKLAEGTANFTITYDGIWGHKYESKITYKTFKEDNALVWKQVGPRHEKLFN